MNGFIIILIISILAEIAIYFEIIKYLKKFLTTTRLDELYEFYKESGLEKDKEEILRVETHNSLSSSKNTLWFSIIACVFAIYMNQEDYLIVLLGSILVFVSIIKYALIKRYIDIIFSKINLN